MAIPNPSNLDRSSDQESTQLPDPVLGEEAGDLSTSRPWFVRVFLRLVGWGAFGLAILGIPLPLLPTTPFLLLAAACFVRSSPELHRRLMQHEKLGPFLRQWQAERSVSASAKRRAYGLVVVSFTISILAVDGNLLRVGLALGGASLLVFLYSLRTSGEDAALVAATPVEATVRSDARSRRPDRGTP